MVGKKIETIKDDLKYLNSYIPKLPFDSVERISLLLNQSSGFGVYEDYANLYVRGALDPADMRTYFLEVSSPLLVNHVSKAIEIAIDKRIIPNIEVDLNGFSLDYSKMYGQTVDIFRAEFSTFCKYVDCTDVVIFGRVESVLDFISMEWLRERGMLEEEIRSIFVEKENQRLSPAFDRLDILCDRIDKERFRELKSTFPREKLSVQRASGLNFNYMGRTIAVVERAWGRDMAFAFAKIIAEEAKPKQVLAIGGCGAVSKEVEIDEPIIPNKIYSPDFSSRVTPLKSGNYLEMPCFSIDTPFDEDDEFLNQISKPSAVEMEMAGYLKALEQYDIPFRTALYVMDNPLKGLTLGKTYHNPEFLKKIFAKHRRGKDRALEALLSVI